MRTPIIMTADGHVGPAKVLVMPKTAIVISLDDLQRLAKEFADETGSGDDLLRQLTLSQFIAWLRKRQLKERDNGSRTDR